MKLSEAFKAWLPRAYRQPTTHYTEANMEAAFLAGAEAAVRAEREGAEPVLYQYRFKGMYGHVWRTSPAGWNGLKPVETRALYSYPPQASATVPEAWRPLLEAVVREIPREGRHGNAPGHGHAVPGIWDSDNGELAGKPCAWCLAWNTAKAMLAATSRPGDKEEGCGYTCPGRGACKAQEGT